MLEVEGLAARYGRTQVVWDVSLTVAPGRLVTLIGANGAGKTTTLNTICGILPAAAGRVRLLGEDIGRLAAHERVRRGLVQVPEGREIFAKLTVRENLELAAWTRRDGGVEVTIHEVMERFPLLRERQHQRAGALSGGEQQMLAIGRGLMARPKLLILDEPSWGLAPMMVETVFAAVKRIQEEGTTVLLVEQNAARALAISDDVYVIEHGRIAMSGPAAELAQNEEVARVYLGSQLEETSA